MNMLWKKCKYIILILEKVYQTFDHAAPIPSGIVKSLWTITPIPFPSLHYNPLILKYKTHTKRIF